MATSKNSVSLVIEAGVIGEEGIRRLSADVRALAKDGGDAAPQFQALAAELDKLGSQAGAVANVKALTEEVTRLSATQAKAAETAAAVGVALTGVTEKAEPLRSKQADLQKAIRDNSEEIVRQRNALTTLKDEYAKEAISEATFRSSKTETTKALTDARLALVQNKNALADLTPALTAVNAEERKLTGQYTALRESVRTANTALSSRNQALQQAQAVALAAGVSTENLVGAEQDLFAATQKIAIETQRLTTAREAGAAVAAELAALDAKNAAAADALSKKLLQVAIDYDREAAAAERSAVAATAAAAAAAKVAAAKLEQSESDRLATIESTSLANAQRAGAQALQAELVTLKESAAFTAVYAESKQRASAEALRYVEALEREALAQDRATRGELERQAALTSTAERTARRAEIERAFVTALDATDVAATEAAAAVQRLADAQEASAKAFGQTGVRSMQAIQTEINGVRTSLGSLNQQYRAGEITVQDYTRAVSSAEVRVATLRRELQTIPALPNVFEKLNSSIQDTISRFGALTAAFATVAFVAKPILDANLALESMRKTLTFVTGSAATADQQIAFLQTTADKAGLSFSALARDFALFEASVVKAGIPLGVAQDLFQGVAAAAGKLGISSERTSNILLALGQVANKGKVSLEELQGQIGEALPGALKIAADSLGVTTVQMSLLLKNGTLLAEEFLPAFGQQLKKVFDDGSKSALTLEQAFARVKNSFAKTSQELADTSAYRGLISITDGLARNFDTLVTSAGSLTKAFIVIKAVDIAREFFGLKAAAEAAAAGKAIDTAASVQGARAAGVQTAAIASTTAALNAQTVALEANAVAQRVAAGAAVSGGAAALGGAAAGVAGAAAGAGAVGLAEAATVAGAAAVGFGKVRAAITGAFGALRGFVGFLGGPYGAAAAVAISFSDQIGNAIASLALKATGVTKQYEANEKALKALSDAEAKAVEVSRAAEAEKNRAQVQLLARNADQIAAAEKATQASRKYVEAVQVEGDATVKLAELIGDQGAARTKAAAAALKTVSAQQSLSEATAKELSLQSDLKDGLIASAGGYERLTAAGKKRVDDLTLEIDKLKANDDLAKARLENLRNEAAQTYIAAEATRDNSGRLAELNDERRAAIALAGTDAESQRRVVIAAGLYADALKDAIRNTQQKNEVEKADLSTREAGLRVSNDQVKASATIAGLLDDEGRGLKALSDQKKIEIEQTQLLSDRKKADAENQITVLRLQKEEIVGTDDLAVSKRKEIDLRIQNEQAKIKETESTPALIKALEEEKRAIELRIVLQQKQSDLRVASVQADNNIVQANIAVQQAFLKVQEQIANAAGNQIAVTKAQVDQKRQQIDATEASTRAVVAEAQERVRLAETELLERTATGTLTAEKKTEIETRIKNAQAKLIEADASFQVVRGLEAEIQALQKQTAAFKLSGDAQRAYLQSFQDGFGLASKDAAAARNSTVASGPSSGSFGELLKNTSSGGITRTVQTGQAVPPDNSGDWLYTSNNSKVESVGVDERGNRLPGGWYLSEAGKAKRSQQNTQQEISRRASAEEALLSGGDPSGRGLAKVETVAGRYEIVFTIGGSTSTVSTANRSEALTLIHNLQEAFKQAGGG